MAVQSGELVEHYKALTDELEEKNRVSKTKTTRSVDILNVKFPDLDGNYDGKRQSNEELARTVRGDVQEQQRERGAHRRSRIRTVDRDPRQKRQIGRDGRPEDRRLLRPTAEREGERDRDLVREIAETQLRFAGIS